MLEGVGEDADDIVVSSLLMEILTLKSSVVVML